QNFAAGGIFSDIRRSNPDGASKDNHMVQQCSKDIGKSLRLRMAVLLMGIFITAAVSGEDAESLRLKEAEGKGESSERIAREGRNYTIPGLELELLWVEPGEFTMGSPVDEPQRNKAEGPQTKVKISRGFWLGKTEVTQ